jgi:hypothetical protein
MKLLLIISILVLLLSSCDKDKSTTGSEVEMYLLQSFQLEAGKCKVDPTSAVLEHPPWLLIMIYWHIRVLHLLINSQMKRF